MSDFTDIITAYGTIRVWHEITLGEMTLFTILSLILIVSVLKFLFKKIWE